MPLQLRLVTVGFARSSVYSPVMFGVSFPLGALIFVAMRGRLLRQAQLAAEAAAEAKGQRVLFDSDAKVCATCEQPVHHGCSHTHAQS